MEDDYSELFGEANEGDHDSNSDKAGEVLEAEEFAELRAAEAAVVSEQLYADGPATPKKRGRGRPTLDEVRKRKVRERVARWRSKQTTGIHKKWQENLAALSEPERAALQAKQTEVAVLSSLMNDAVAMIAANASDDYFGDLFREIRSFISRPGCELVRDWITDLAADSMNPEQWDCFDDQIYRHYGLRTRIWMIQYREFLRSLTQDAAFEPEVGKEVARLLADLDPPQEPKYVVEPVPFVSEADRERRIREKEIVEESMAREVANFEKWQARQLGSQLEDA